ncbi:hypothetical protein DdX_16929 [Ditylenchus destructor]|uniref:Uncharacterized protein n=1 Tax=Ditylenchus destructor TaxID=166010 RepID=A0AAD4MPW4_9BILA|nr:hypothetical protein DdX_16929 [Ditylenchus destructor]
MFHVTLPFLLWITLALVPKSQAPSPHFVTGIFNGVEDDTSVYLQKYQADGKTPIGESIYTNTLDGSWDIVLENPDFNAKYKVWVMIPPTAGAKPDPVAMKPAFKLNTASKGRKTEFERHNPWGHEEMKRKNTDDKAPNYFS